ncbi:MAG: hypothetical protein HOP07_10015 [Bacteriovoracaceae bacterium]|nr:hypothetical protein [Bacteriovoracaceae bacterium]
MAFGGGRGSGGKPVTIIRRNPEFKKGKNGQWYQAKKNRRWERSDSSYKIIVQLSTVLEKKMITIPIANKLKKSFEEVMVNKGELVEMYTDFKDTVFLFLKIHRKFSPAEIISTLKSASSREIKDLVNGIDRGKGVYGKAYWGSGYEIYTEFLDIDPEWVEHFKLKELKDDKTNEKERL